MDKGSIRGCAGGGGLDPRNLVFFHVKNYPMVFVVQIRSLYFLLSETKSSPLPLEGCMHDACYSVPFHGTLLEKEGCSKNESNRPNDDGENEGSRSMERTRKPEHRNKKQKVSGKSRVTTCFQSMKIMRSTFFGSGNTCFLVNYAVYPYFVAKKYDNEVYPHRYVPSMPCRVSADTTLFFSFTVASPAYIFNEITFEEGGSYLEFITLSRLVANIVLIEHEEEENRKKSGRQERYS
jgi:hypothetical protein